MVRHIRDKVAEARYASRAVLIRAHYFTLCEICSNRGGKPTFPATLNEITRLTHCSRRSSVVCLQDLQEIGAVSRSREGRGTAYTYTLLALHEGARVVQPLHQGSATIAPGVVHGVHGYKNKVHIRVPTLSELLGISGTSKNKNPQKKGGSVEKKQQNQNGKPPPP
jgi:hypothetical protein